MTELLYLQDCYAKEFEAIVTEVKENEVELDQTLFYPNSGGQPNDTGFPCSDIHLDNSDLSTHHKRTLSSAAPSNGSIQAGCRGAPSPSYNP